MMFVLFFSTGQQNWHQLNLAVNNQGLQLGPKMGCSRSRTMPHGFNFPRGPPGIRTDNEALGAGLQPDHHAIPERRLGTTPTGKRGSLGKQRLPMDPNLRTTALHHTENGKLNVAAQAGKQSAQALIFNINSK